MPINASQETTLTHAQPIQAYRTQLPGQRLRGVKNVIAIASGKGGVGKSTVAVNLAVALARDGARVGLLDADIYGPSIPMMLGAVPALEQQGEQCLPMRIHGIQAMSIGYLTPDDHSALIWRGPMLAKSLIQLLNITLWDNLDYLLIDLPPGTGDIQLTLVQKIPLAGAIIVTTPQQIATLDAQKGLSMFQKTGIYTLGIIENMANYHCSQCGHEENIFGTGGATALAEQNHCELLGQIPLDPRIGLACEQGLPAGLDVDASLAAPWIRAARRFTQVLCLRPVDDASPFPPIVAR
jgi:ATP-binding protein involved in chromosome partitioning